MKDGHSSCVEFALGGSLRHHCSIVAGARRDDPAPSLSSVTITAAADVLPRAVDIAAARDGALSAANAAGRLSLVKSSVRSIDVA